MSLPTLTTAPPTDAPSDQSVPFIDYIALFLDYFIVLVVFYGTLTLGFALATHDDVRTLADFFGVLLLPSTFLFISGMVSSVVETDGIEPSFVFVCHLETLALFGMCTLAEICACINRAGAPSDIMIFGLMLIWGMSVCILSWLFCSATTAARTLGKGERVIVTKVTCQWIARVMSRQKLEWADENTPEAEAISWPSQLARGRIPDEKTTLLNHDAV